MSNLEYNIRNCALWVSRLCRPVRSDEQGTRAESRWVLWPGANTGTHAALHAHTSQLSAPDSCGGLSHSGCYRTLSAAPAARAAHGPARKSLYKYKERPKRGNVQGTMRRVLIYTIVV